MAELRHKFLGTQSAQGPFSTPPTGGQEWSIGTFAGVGNSSRHIWAGSYQKYNHTFFSDYSISKNNCSVSKDHRKQYKKLLRDKIMFACP